MSKKDGPPVFIKKEDSVQEYVIDPELAKLGVKLSEKLPTFDVPIKLIRANAWNPNVMKDQTFNRLVQEMEETGMVDAIQLVPAEGGKFVIIGGEHRFHGAKTLGWETIPANILTDDKFIDVNLQKLLTVRLNVIRGNLNPEKFTRLYEEMVRVYGKEQLQALFGFTSSDAWKKLTGGIVDSIKKAGIGNKELLDSLNKGTRKVRTVDGLGKIINKLFEKYGSDLDHSFMVFTYGKKEHLYIIMNEQTRRAMDKIKEWCRSESKDINDVIGALMERVVSELKGEQNDTQ